MKLTQAVSTAVAATILVAPIAAVGVFSAVAFFYKPKSAWAIVRDKPYFTGESTSFYSPGNPSDLTSKAVTDDRYFVASRRLDNGKTGVSITPLAIHHNDSHWFELLDLDGDHTTVEKKLVGQAVYQTVQIPFVSGTDVSFTPVRMNVARIPTKEDHDLMQRLVAHAKLQ